MSDGSCSDHDQRREEPHTQKWRKDFWSLQTTILAILQLLFVLNEYSNKIFFFFNLTYSWQNSPEPGRLLFGVCACAAAGKRGAVEQGMCTCEQTLIRWTRRTGTVTGGKATCSSNTTTLSSRQARR